MIISDTITAAIVAGLVSIIVSLIGFMAIRHRIKHDKKISDEEIQLNFSHQLYEQRVKIYPKGFAITGKILRKKKPELLPSIETLRTIKYELNKWVNEEAGLFLSRDSLKTYWELRNMLNKNQETNGQWSQGQTDRLFIARKKFRKSLRQDLGNLYLNDFNDEDTEDYWETL